jgi:PTS system cellobiose-specific IIC component
MVVLIPLMPVLIQAIMTNGALVAAGESPVFHPIFLILPGIGGTLGGTGCTIGLVLMGLRSKSAQIKAVSRAGLVPAFFNINEPVAFGMPTVYNPILAIPYVVTPFVTMVLYWVGYSTGFLTPPYIYMMSFMPYGMGEFMVSMSWINLIFPFLLIPVSMLLWLPFYKIYERQLVAKEAAAASEASAVEEAEEEKELTEANQ